MTSPEAAKSLNSPKGLMLHGEVGTGKSMLVDLFADCLPNKKKRRWHFNTFMLETFSRLEQLRRDRLSRIPPSVAGLDQDDFSLLWLARDMINTSPILFLDEFQLPDRAASKIMTNLMTSFFQLGGVLIATSNRMPEELNKAAGTAYAQPPSRLESLRWRFGASNKTGKSESMFAGQGEFADFLDVLKARCDVWEMGGGKDYRRQEAEGPAPEDPTSSSERWELDEHQDLQSIPSQYTQDLEINHQDRSMSSTGSLASLVDSLISKTSVEAPRNYMIIPEVGSSDTAQEEFIQKFITAEKSATVDPTPTWTPTTMRVFGRTIHIPRSYNGVSSWTFAELCGRNLGPADYITLASNYHTIILTSVPILTFLQKNEARRFITLLDALYEARCKLLITAQAGPDSLFFPETTKGDSDTNPDDAVYPETLSEVYQDSTAPFRPNISTQNPEYAEPDYEPSPEPDYTHARLQGMLAPDSLEDDPPNRVVREGRRGERGPIDPDDDWRLGSNSHRSHQRAPNFANTGSFTGEDERFAYKRARSRLWEMCGAKWWARNEEGWHRPLPLELRRWEAVQPSVPLAAGDNGVLEEAADAGLGASEDIDEKKDEVLFRHGASPFRTAREPPPKFSWTHVWGTMKWGKKAGAWGQGVEGLKDRNKEKK